MAAEPVVFSCTQTSAYAVPSGGSPFLSSALSAANLASCDLQCLFPTSSLEMEPPGVS